VTRGARLALSLFTRVPARDGEPSLRDVRWAVTYAPVVGLLLGLAAAASSVVIRLFFRDYAAPFLPSVLAIGAVALLTGAASLRGVASYGVVPLVFLLLVEVSALSEATASQRGSVSVLVAFTVGRLALTMSATRATRAAERDGLAWQVAGTLGRSRAFAMAALVAAGAYVTAAADDHAGRRGGVRAVLAVVLALAAAHVVGWLMVRRDGGLTTSALHAVVEVATAVALVVMALDLNCTPESGLDRLLRDRCTF
jgi:adenosylcobinamide-GDP ribazoletransferase